MDTFNTATNNRNKSNRAASNTMHENGILKYICIILRQLKMVFCSLFKGIKMIIPERAKSTHKKAQ